MARAVVEVSLPEHQPQIMPKRVRDDARRKVMTLCLSAMIIISCWTHNAASIVSAKASHDISMALSTNAVKGGKGRGAKGQKRRKYARVDSASFPIARDILNLCKNFTSEKQAETFRKRYRVTPQVFEILVNLVKNSKYAEQFFGPDQKDCCGRRSHPIDIYVAASLLHLGTGLNFCTHIAWLAGISGTRLLAFHHNVMTRVFGDPRSPVYKKHVGDMASNDADGEITLEKLKEMERPYSLLGLAGAIASMDGVHIPWERAPSGSRSWYVGKSGSPCLQFNVSVDRSGKFINIEGPHSGCSNDKTMVRTDSFALALKEGKKTFCDLSFQLFRHDGSLSTEKGAYIIVDGGY